MSKQTRCAWCGCPLQGKPVETKLGLMCEEFGSCYARKEQRVREHEEKS